MKRNVYQCPNCGSKMRTAERDPGLPPAKLGCQEPGCGTMAPHRDYLCEQTGEYDILLISPKNENDWDLIQQTTEETLQVEHPKKNARRIRKDAHKIVNGLLSYVSNGGLVPILNKKSNG